MSKQKSFELESQCSQRLAAVMSPGSSFHSLAAVSRDDRMSATQWKCMGRQLVLTECRECSGWSVSPDRGVRKMMKPLGGSSASEVPSSLC